VVEQEALSLIPAADKSYHLRKGCVCVDRVRKDVHLAGWGSTSPRANKITADGRVQVMIQQMRTPSTFFVWSVFPDQEILCPLLYSQLLQQDLSPRTCSLLVNEWASEHKLFQKTDLSKGIILMSYTMLSVYVYTGFCDSTWEHTRSRWGKRGCDGMKG
jgi:hypothetical protein